MEKERIAIFWFRRDLRIHDNAGLYHALRSEQKIIPLFIFDKQILDQLEDDHDARVHFIYLQIEHLRKQFHSDGIGFEVRYGTPTEVFEQLAIRYEISGVYTNHDYEPYAEKRDAGIRNFLNQQSIPFYTYKDHVIFEKNEILKDDGQAYTVFTPYSKKWLLHVNDFFLAAYPTEKYSGSWFRQPEIPMPLLQQMGFKPAGRQFPDSFIDKELIRNYDKMRDYPGLHGTSHLGLHLRFGTISIRELASVASELNDVYLKELIWREFYQMILWHFPQVGEGRSFKPEYDLIPWRNNEQEFERWCNGCTGYPLVDAGMRELNTTGYMHNRVRMVTASFLTKHLLIDWRWGEAYFAERLLDFELASNNGGWQWAAGSGCDAAPYFRIFNPTLQAQKFDKNLYYIKQWIPELDSIAYPKPIVEHEFARKRCLEVYIKAIKAFRS